MLARHCRATRVMMTARKMMMMLLSVVMMTMTMSGYERNAQREKVEMKMSY